jgi:hypothetical protein
MHSNLFVQVLSFATVSEGYDSSCFDSDTTPSFYESLSKYPLLIITILVLDQGGYLEGLVLEDMLLAGVSMAAGRWIHIKMRYMYVYAD